MEVNSPGLEKDKKFRLKEDRRRMEIIPRYIIMRFTEKILKLLRGKYRSHRKNGKSDEI